MDKSPDAFRTISEVADLLDTPAHVLRFWESRFTQIRPVKRAGGRRYYRPTDVALLAGIRLLLHEQGLTIRGVQKILREQGVRHVCALGNEPGILAEAHEEWVADDRSSIPAVAPVVPEPAPEVETVIPWPGPRPRAPDPVTPDPPEAAHPPDEIAAGAEGPQDAAVHPELPGGGAADAVAQSDPEPGTVTEAKAAGPQDAAVVPDLKPAVPIGSQGPDKTDPGGEAPALADTPSDASAEPGAKADAPDRPGADETALIAAVLAAVPAEARQSAPDAGGGPVPESRDQAVHGNDVAGPAPEPAQPNLFGDLPHQARPLAPPAAAPAPAPPAAPALPRVRPDIRALALRIGQIDPGAIDPAALAVLTRQAAFLRDRLKTVPPRGTP